MKTFALLAVSILLVGILFCPTVMAFPSIPDDVQMVQPDPSLPKELSAFFGKWQGISGKLEFFLIVEKIGKKKARVYHWRSGSGRRGYPGWGRTNAEVIQDRGKYKLRFIVAEGTIELTLRGEYLDLTGPVALSVVLTRVP